MDRGYVKLWRKTLDSAVMEHESALYLFVWLLLNADRQASTVWNGKKLPAGNYITSVRKLAKEIGWGKTKTSECLDFLEHELKMIHRQTSNNETAIAIKNWPIYQGGESPTEGVSESGPECVAEADTSGKVCRPRGQSVSPTRTECVAHADTSQYIETRRSTRRSTRRKNALRLEELTWPKALDTPVGREALTEWLEYKLQRGQAYKGTMGPQKILNEFGPLGDEALRRAIDASIRNNYAGVFPSDNRNGKTNRPGRGQVHDPDYADDTI